EYGFVHLSAGELLRQARDSPGSEFASEIQEHMKNGTIVPAEITCGLLYQVCIQRCLGRKSNRVDDNEETLKHRIKQFKEQCMPIIQFYEAQNLVTRINANKSIPEVIFYHTIF
ncbi:UMP-CMP kinase, partial [Schistosoma bovis]